MCLQRSVLKLTLFFVRFRVHFLSIFEGSDLEFDMVFTSRNAHAGISGLSCGPSAAVRFLHVSTPKFDLVFDMCLDLTVKDDVEKELNLTIKFKDCGHQCHEVTLFIQGQS